MKNGGKNKSVAFIILVSVCDSQSIMCHRKKKYRLLILIIILIILLRYIVMTKKEDTIIINDTIKTLN